MAPSVARAYGGPVYSLIGFVEALQSQGVECEVCAPASAAADLAHFAEAAPSIRLHVFPATGRNAFIVSSKLQQWLRREVYRFDVVHIYGTLNPVSSLAARTCRLARKPYVIHPFGTLSRYTYEHRRSWMKQIYFHVLDRANLEGASAVHFTTATEQSEASWRGVRLGARQYVIPPPWTGGVATVRPDRQDEAAEPVVLLLARLNPVKRIELLLRAWVEVLERVGSARLVIAGSGETGYERDLRRLATEIGLADHVSFSGFVAGQEKAELLARAQLLVLPSYHENFGVVVVEALAAGLPVVLTPEVQLSEYVRAHDFGLVSKGEEHALADCIVRALGDTTLQERCRREAPIAIASTFALAVIGEQLALMYSAALKSPHYDAVTGYAVKG